jgi:3-oxoacyl-[acyl-carrier protein] reductase
MKRLEGKVAIITGAASGMGKATAIKYCQEGAKVVIADISDEGQKTAEEINSYGGDAYFVKTDVSNYESIQNLVKETVERYGKIDILYNNAALPQKTKPFYETSQDEFERIFDVNVTGPFLLCKEVYPEFKKVGGGVYLATASLGGVFPRAGSIAYSPTKAAIINMYKVLASELAKDNIRANVILPGPTETPMLKKFMEPGRDQLSDKELAQNVSGSMPLGRLVQPGDIADAAVFLASDEASMITGETLLVDGGRSVARGKD